LRVGGILVFNRRDDMCCCGYYSGCSGSSPSLCTSTGQTVYSSLAEQMTVVGVLAAVKFYTVHGFAVNTSTTALAETAILIWTAHRRPQARWQFFLWSRQWCPAIEHQSL